MPARATSSSRWSRATAGRSSPSLERMGVLLESADTDALGTGDDAIVRPVRRMGVAELRAIDEREPEALRAASSARPFALPFQLPESFLLFIRTISLVSGVTSALNCRLQHVDAVDPFRADRCCQVRVGGYLRRPASAGARSTPRALARLPRPCGCSWRRASIAARSRYEPRSGSAAGDRSNRTLHPADLGDRVRGSALRRGPLARPTDEVLGWVLMGASAFPRCTSSSLCADASARRARRARTHRGGDPATPEDAPQPGEALEGLSVLSAFVAEW